MILMPKSSGKTITIPDLKLPKNITPILIALLVIAAFAIGVLVTKVSYLEKGITPNTDTTVGTTGGAPAPAAPAPGQKVDVSNGHLQILGEKNAKVTVIEFSDFQCPFCEQWFKTVEPDLIKEYVNTGKVKFVYRQFPLTSIHPNAYKASSASECANEQGKFWGYHDLLFKNQAAWSNLDSAAAAAKFKEYAGTLGLNTGNFNSCLDSDKYKSEIDKDLADGTAAGVNGTPATFVNGQSVIGAQPFASFKALIDAELAK